MNEQQRYAILYIRMRALEINGVHIHTTHTYVFVCVCVCVCICVRSCFNTCGYMSLQSVYCLSVSDVNVCISVFMYVYMFMYTYGIRQRRKTQTSRQQLSTFIPIIFDFMKWKEQWTNGIHTYARTHAPTTEQKSEIQKPDATSVECKWL